MGGKARTPKTRPTPGLRGCDGFCILARRAGAEGRAVPATRAVETAMNNS